MLAPQLTVEDEAIERLTGEGIDPDDRAALRARLLARAELTRRVIVYRFVFPPGAAVPGLGRGGQMRGAQGQLQLLVSLTGGAIIPSPGGLAARIPKVLAPRFEAIAAPLIADWLVARDLGEEGV